MIRKLKINKKVRLSLCVFNRWPKGFDTFQKSDNQPIFCSEFLVENSNFSCSLFPDNRYIIRAKLKENRQNIVKNGLRFINFQYSIELLSNALSDSPFPLIFLKLFKHSNQGLPFLFTENMHDIWHVLDNPKLYLITFVLEKRVDYFEQIFLCLLLTDYLCNLVETFAQGYLYFLC